MLDKWFECKVKYTKIMKNGLEKPTTETYLVDALSFSEAEGRFLEEIRPFMSGEFSVEAVGKKKIADVFFNDKAEADKWFKCKLAFISVDERSGAEKKTSSTILVQASDLREAVKYLDEQMKGTLGDYEIATVVETSIMDVYPYEASKQ